MIILRSLRLLNKIKTLPLNSALNHDVQTRCLRQISRPNTSLISPSEELSEDEKAKHELAQLTGGISMQELQMMLEPNKHKNNVKKTNENEEQTKSELIPRDENAVGLLPTFNLAAYVKDSELLQQFVKLGVDLSAVEKRKGLPEFLLRLEVEKDVQPRLLFLQDQGVPAEMFGELITKNPLIFKVDLDDMQTRVHYLESKKFSKQQIQRILTLNPFWLMFSTKRIDNRLGYFQKEFRLGGDNIRFLSSKLPKLITYNMDHLRKATFCIREEMGFDKEEIKALLLAKPRLWMLSKS